MPSRRQCKAADRPDTDVGIARPGVAGGRAVQPQKAFFLAKGRDPEARLWALRAMQARPHRPVPHLIMGKVLEREGNREIALLAYQTVLHLCPQHAEAERGVRRLQKNPAGQESSEPR